MRYNITGPCGKVCECASCSATPADDAKEWASACSQSWIVRARGLSVVQLQCRNHEVSTPRLARSSRREGRTVSCSIHADRKWVRPRHGVEGREHGSPTAQDPGQQPADKYDRRRWASGNIGRKRRTPVGELASGYEGRDTKREKELGFDPVGFCSATLRRAFRTTTPGSQKGRTARWALSSGPATLRAAPKALSGSKERIARRDETTHRTRHSGRRTCTVELGRTNTGIKAEARQLSIHRTK